MEVFTIQAYSQGELLNSQEMLNIRELLKTQDHKLKKRREVICQVLLNYFGRQSQDQAVED